jgi:hypothetical protein
MEATCSSKKSVDFQRTGRRYIPEDSTLQNTLFVATDVACDDAINNKLEASLSEIKAVRGKITSDK